MKLSELAPGIIFLDNDNNTCVKMNPNQRYLNKSRANERWALIVRTGGFEKMDKESLVSILIRDEDAN